MRPRNSFIFALGIVVFVAYFIDVFVLSYIKDNVHDSTIYTASHQEGGSVSIGFLATNLLALKRFMGYLLVNFHEEIIAAFTMILVGVTAALARYTYLLWSSNVRLIDDAKKSSERQLRAYVGVKDQVIRRLPDGRFQAVVTIENSGQTPAHNVCRALEVGTGDTSRTRFDVPRLTGKMPMSPNTQWELRQVLWDLSEQDVLQITDGSSGRHAFVWGRIEYLDIYGDRQHVNYRFISREVSTVNVPGQPSQLAGWALHPTEDGNDAT